MLGGLAGLIVMNSLGAGLAGAIVGMSVPFVQLRNKIRSRAVQISKGLPEALQVLTISLKAGHALKGRCNDGGRNAGRVG